MNKILSITIPTYNRSEKLLKLLEFINEEISALNCSNEIIEVVVSNNCSTDNTDSLLRKIVENNNYPFVFRYHCNEKNEGLLGNLLTVANLAEGKYLWIMGDDDLYHRGIVSKVFEKVKHFEYSYIFINHATFKLNVGDGANSMLDGININRTDSEVILDILNCHPGAPMFISAQVYETKYVKEFINKKMPINICLPLGLSLYTASQGKTGVVPETMIDDDCGNISWSNVMNKVDLFLRPIYFIMAISLSFRKIKSIKLFVSYVYKRKWQYFRYFIVRPLKRK